MGLDVADLIGLNACFGLGLGAGRPLRQVVEEIGQEAEGIDATRELYQKSRGMGVEMPITEAVFRVLYENLTPMEAVQSLMAREPSRE